MKLKINHLTNLADARYCAAMGVHFVSFSHERGSLYNLPDRAVQEILPWLSGPDAVLDFGADTQAQNAWLATLTELPAQTWLQGTSESLYPLGERYWQTLPQGSMPHQPHIRTEAEWTLSAPAWLEALPADTSPATLAWLTKLHTELLPGAQLCINLDGCGPGILPLLGFAPHAVSMRSLVQADLLNLDYDAFEQLQTQLMPVLEA